jgi:hypothetical protein
MVYLDIWNDPKYQALSDDAKLLRIYVMTNPHSTMLGLYSLPMGYISVDLGWDIKRAEQAEKECLKANYVERSQSNGLILVPDIIISNPIDGPNQCKHCLSLVEQLSYDEHLFNKLADIIEVYSNHHSEPLVERIRNPYVNPSNNPLQENNNQKRKRKGRRISNKDNPDNDSQQSTGKEVPTQEIIQLHNEICEDLDKVIGITAKRKSLIIKRHAQLKFIDGWRSFFSKVHRSDFLCNRLQDKKFKAQFDWILNDETFIKIQEGFYDNKTNVNNSSSNKSHNKSNNKFKGCYERPI